MWIVNSVTIGSRKSFNCPYRTAMSITVTDYTIMTYCFNAIERSHLSPANHEGMKRRIMNVNTSKLARTSGNKKTSMAG